MQKLELHQKTMMSVLKDAYDLGREDATNQFTQDKFDVEEVVNNWIVFIEKFEKLYSDTGLRYSDGENIYTLDNMIKGFKLSYGY